jgi:hypothetical protein
MEIRNVRSIGAFINGPTELPEEFDLISSKVALGAKCSLDQLVRFFELRCPDQALS